MHIVCMRYCNSCRQHRRLRAFRYVFFVILLILGGVYSFDIALAADIALADKGVAVDGEDGKSLQVRRVSQVGEHAQMRDKVREGDKVQEGNKVRVRDSATRDSMRWTKVRWFRPVKGKIVRRFYLPNYHKKGNRGVDFESRQGEKVRATRSGTVHFSGWIVDRYVISIKHLGGLISTYEPVRSSLKKGDAVKAGAEIGTIWSDGPRGSNLHFGIKDHLGYLDPMLFLKAGSRAVLLPVGSAGVFYVS